MLREELAKIGPSTARTSAPRLSADFLRLSEEVLEIHQYQRDLVGADEIQPTA